MTWRGSLTRRQLEMLVEIDHNGPIAPASGNKIAARRIDALSRRGLIRQREDGRYQTTPTGEVVARGRVLERVCAHCRGLPGKGIRLWSRRPGEPPFICGACVARAVSRMVGTKA